MSISEEHKMSEMVPLIEQCFAAGKDVTITVRGNSMYPLFLNRRDRVVLTACDGAALKRGDLPLYEREPGHFVLHRIVGKNGDGFVMCGDAQIVLEPGIRPDQIVGVVKGFYRKGKYISSSSFFYRMYVALWMRVRPLHPYLNAVYRRVVRETLKD